MSNFRRRDYDFSNYSLQELDELFRKQYFNNDKKLLAIAEERYNRLNSTFIQDEAFLQQFITINNHLTKLSNELYDKMLAIKASLNSLIQDKTTPIQEFDLEGTITYTNSETVGINDIEVMELLCNMDNSIVWRVYMTSKDEISREDALMNNLNWNIDLFDSPLIKESNIWVSYVMYSLFYHQQISLVDLMQMKPEYFDLSITSSLDI